MLQKSQRLSIGIFLMTATNMAIKSQILSLTKETNETGRKLSKWRIQIFESAQKNISCLPLIDTLDLK